jgi:hypothetical protein
VDLLKNEESRRTTYAMPPQLLHNHRIFRLLIACQAQKTMSGVLPALADDFRDPHLLWRGGIEGKFQPQGERQGGAVGLFQPKLDLLGNRAVPLNVAEDDGRTRL